MMWRRINHSSFFSTSQERTTVSIQKTFYSGTLFSVSLSKSQILVAFGIFTADLKLKHWYNFSCCRLPFRNVVVGLLANQLLLQTIGSVLLTPESVNSPSPLTDEKHHTLSGTGPIRKTSCLHFFWTWTFYLFIFFWRRGGGGGQRKVKEYKW